MGDYVPWLILGCVVGWLLAVFSALSWWGRARDIKDWKAILQDTRDILQREADTEKYARLRLFRLVRYVYQSRHPEAEFRNPFTIERVQGFADTVDYMKEERKNVDIIGMMDAMFPPVHEESEVSDE